VALYHRAIDWKHYREQSASAGKLSFFRNLYVIKVYKSLSVIVELRVVADGGRGAASPWGGADERRAVLGYLRT
jgi:hypothetical protein